MERCSSGNRTHPSPASGTQASGAGACPVPPSPLSPFHLGGTPPRLRCTDDRAAPYQTTAAPSGAATPEEDGSPTSDATEVRARRKNARPPPLAASMPNYPVPGVLLVCRGLADQQPSRQPPHRKVFGAARHVPPGPHRHGLSCCRLQHIRKQRDAVLDQMPRWSGCQGGSRSKVVVRIRLCVGAICIIRNTAVEPTKVVSEGGQVVVISGVCGPSRS